jgi:hypothetical protein
MKITTQNTWLERMARSPRSDHSRNRWSVRKTILIVVEGADEEGFLKHVRSIFVPRDCGISVTIRNAKGKGADHVLRKALTEKARSSYDKVAAMYDTDTENPRSALKNNALNKRIILLRSEPCLEATLIKLVGEDPYAVNTDWKTRVESLLNGYPPRDHRADWSKVTAGILRNQRSHLSVIDHLLNLLDIHPPVP